MVEKEGDRQVPGRTRLFEPIRFGGGKSGNRGRQMVDVRRADLHTHTYYSDGHLSPRELVETAGQHGLVAIAITDHDTIDGLVEGQRAGMECGVEVIPGVELSVTVCEESVHLLGYFFDPAHAELREHVERFIEHRRERVHRIVEHLSASGMALSFEAVQAQAKGRVLGRPHVAGAMVEAGHVKMERDAFQQYLADGNPACAPLAPFSAVEALALLHKAGGIGVLAHPGHWTADQTVMTLVRCGLDGIETMHPSHDATLTGYYGQLARDMGLLETGGSDFHRPGPGSAMGKTAISYAWLARARNVAETGRARRAL